MEWLTEIGITSILCLIFLCMAKCYVNHTMSQIESILSDALEKKPILEGNKNDIVKADILDTRESKLIAQTRQVIAMAQKDYLQAETEKQAVKTLISDLSHQLKTPLANLVLYTELLQQEEITEQERQEFLLCTRNETEKIQWLMKMLIKISRLETNMIQFEAECSFLKETLAQSINIIYHEAARRNILLIIEEFENCKVKHNRKWTVEAIGNILENAVKYSPENSSISIAVSTMEFYIKIDIIDQGIGISKEDYNNIFKRFFRGKQADQYQGSGIGLYLTQLILGKEGGYVTVSSEVGKGSCFSIFLLKG